MDHTITSKKAIYQDQNIDIEKIREEMYQRQRVRKIRKTAVRLGANVIMVLIILLPLLYAVSVALMPSSELFTTQLNLIPKNPTLSNFKEALAKVPLVRFVLNSFLVAGVITFGQIISCQETSCSIFG